MKVSLLLLLACTAVLAVGTRADTPEEPKALVKFQELAEKATTMAKDAFTRVRESKAVQQARQWLVDNTQLAKERLVWLKEQLVELLKKTPTK